MHGTTPTRIRWTNSSGIRTALAFATAALIVTTAIVLPAASAGAAAGHTFKYFGTSSSGTSIRIVGESGSFATRYYGLQGQSGATSQDSYSVDFRGTPPATNTSYTEKDWTDALPAGAQAARGEVEWLIKNSYPRASVTALRTSAGLGGPLSNGDATAATQAAIWHYTDGIDLDVAATTSANLKVLYAYLVAQAAGKAPTSPTGPTLDLTSDTGRELFSIPPAGWFGPFTAASSTTLTLAVTGSAARVVNVDGVPLTGTLAAGTSFWIQPTAAPAASGSAVITAQGQNVTSSWLNAVTGSFTVAPTTRETLAVLASSTQRATDTLAVEWEIDRSSPGSFDPDGGATTRTFDYYAPGVKSATLQTLRWADGTTTTTDLIGLTGTGGSASASVYSADFAGTASTYGPALPPVAGYVEGDWTAAPHLAGNTAQGEVAWVLQHSYPATDVAALTAAVRAAGQPLSGTGNVKNWDAIAATQAAVWHLTDGRELDTTRYPDPTSATGAGGVSASALLDADAATVWRADAAGQASIDFTFAVPVELRSYTVTTAAGGSQAATPAQWRLQRSIDGSTWSEVSSSATSHGFAGGAAETRQTVLGASATFGGSRHYRLVATAADATQPVALGGIRFDGFGVFGTQPTLEYREYANETSIVGVYRYLVDGARAGAVPNPAPVVDLSAAETSYERDTVDDVIGPFTATGSTAIRVRVVGAGDARLIAETGGTPETELVLASGDAFFVHPGSGARGALTITATGSAIDWVTARALTGTDRSGNPAPTLAQLGVASVTASDSLAVGFVPTPTAAVRLGATSALPGGSVEASGTGYRPGETVEVQLHSRIRTLGTAVADATGAFTLRVGVPADAEAGAHHVVAVGLTTSRTARAPFTVTPRPAAAPAATDVTRLPSTGVDGVAPLAGAAALIVLLGVAVLLVTRRRTRTR